MKLCFDLEIVEMGGSFSAVPIGDAVDEFHGVVQLNDTGAEILQLIMEHDTPEAVYTVLCKNHPESDPGELGRQLCDFLNELVREELLIP